MTTLDGPVGLRNGMLPVRSLHRDQDKIINLLWRINPLNGGQQGLGEPPEAGADHQCEPRLALAIAAFQAFLVAGGEARAADGVVDPRGRTLARMDQLAGAPPPLPVPAFLSFNGIRIRNRASAALGAAHDVPNPVILPGSVGPFLAGHHTAAARLMEGNATGRMHEFLFEIEKGGSTFWAGAAVPAGTSDFTKAYVYFHPTVVNGGQTHASEGDYRHFRGGWSGSIQRYVAMQGGQMAAARQMTLIVPFMTMGSMGGGSANMFSDRAVDTLNAIMAAIQAELLPGAANPAALGGIGAASFSSGVGHLSKFLGFPGVSALVRETIDFDSAFIVSAHSSVPAVAGAGQWQVTQVSVQRHRIGWLALPEPAWRQVRTYDSIYARIGWMMFYSMMIFSGFR